MHSDGSRRRLMRGRVTVVVLKSGERTQSHRVTWCFLADNKFRFGGW